MALRLTVLQPKQAAYLLNFARSFTVQADSWTAPLAFSKVVEGKRVGRIVDGIDTGDMVDEHEFVDVTMNNARRLTPAPSLDSTGFELRECPSSVVNFRDDDEVQQVYYKEIEQLVAEATGASKVIVFDHTVRTSSATQLNTLGEKGAAAAAVARVHCDYTAESAPTRFKQLAEGESYTGVRLEKSEVDRLMRGRFAFVNVWRGISEEPVQTKPLAVCDATSVAEEDRFLYQLVFSDRVGENYSLRPRDGHRWAYYPRMRREECLLFNVFHSQEEDGTPRFVFHTAFDDPCPPIDPQAGAPDRMSIETRTIVCWDDDGEQTASAGGESCSSSLAKGEAGNGEGVEEEAAAVFFDMAHSNNAARVRLWLALRGVPASDVSVRMVTYPDLQSQEFAAVNPLKKVPALVTASGQTVFESSVIMAYMEDKYGATAPGPSLMLDSAEERARVNLLVRVHDLYIASPNCTQPGFAHTQGAMYLAPYATAHCSPERAMSRHVRAGKLAEIWKQLTWLEAQLDSEGPFMTGDRMTHADLTWYPTCTFMEYMLPRVFGWPELFVETEHFPRLTAWYTNLTATFPACADAREGILKHWEKSEAEGQFDSIRRELYDPTFKWVYP